MGLRGFDRIYYAIEKSGAKTLVCPYRRLYYDDELQSLVIAEPLTPEPITIELWQMAEQEDIDRFQWGKKRPISVDTLLGFLVADSDITPWGIDGTDEMDEAGVHWDGRGARTFAEGEEVSLDDIRVIAHEEMDRDAAERISDYTLVVGEDGSTIALTLFPMDAELLCGEMDLSGEGSATTEPMSHAGIRRFVDFITIRHAVLEKYKDEWVLVAGADTFSHASALAEYRRSDDGREVAVWAVRS